MGDAGIQNTAVPRCVLRVANGDRVKRLIQQDFKYVARKQNDGYTYLTRI